LRAATITAATVVVSALALPPSGVLARFTVFLVAAAVQRLVAGGVSARTVCTMLTVLSMALTAAMKRGLVARNVAQLVDRPTIQYREMSTWMPLEAEAFRAHVQNDRPYACAASIGAAVIRRGLPRHGTRAVAEDGAPIGPETYSKMFTVTPKRRECRRSGCTTLATRRRRGCSTAARPSQRRRSGWAMIQP